jgi:hypothetical protein
MDKPLDRPFQRKDFLKLSVSAALAGGYFAGLAEQKKGEITEAKASLVNYLRALFRLTSSQRGYEVVTDERSVTQGRHQVPGRCH